VARAHAAEFDKDDTLESFMVRIKERDAERIVRDDLDALFLRTIRSRISKSGRGQVH
jgi:glutathione synthase